MNETNKKNQKKVKHTTIRIPIEIYEEIEKEALENERDISKQINYMLKKYIEIKKI